MNFLGSVELESILATLVRENELLASENEVFDSYLKRNAGSRTNQEEDRKEKKLKQRRQKQPMTLTTEQKLEVATVELEEVQKEIVETKKSSERLIDTLRAVLEETDIRIGELKKDAYEFKRDIVVGAENFRTGKTIAEKVIRYMEEKLRQKDAIVEKLRLKNATLKTQAQKVDAQLRQKEEMGDALHYIDFHQLQIENKQYVAKIEERNDELLKLKMTTGNTVQVLNNLKRKLGDLMQESQWLNHEIEARTNMNQHLQQEQEKIIEKIAREKRSTKKLNSTPENTEMPNIMDYVQQKANMYELQSDIKNLERKLEIAEMAAKAKQKEVRQAQQSHE